MAKKTAKPVAAKSAAAKRATRKPSVKNRTLTPKGNRPGAPASPGQEQDIKRRLGNFEGKGQAPRKGGRHGIRDTK